MDKNVVNSWPKDTYTDLPQVPQGWLSDFSDLKNSQKPPHIRALPVLRGVLNPKKFDFVRPQPNCAGIERTVVGDAIALTVYFQLGASAFFWFLNPADNDVRAALDKWAAARTMVLAPEFPDGRTAVVAVPFVEPSSISIMRPAVTSKEHTAKFQAEVCKLLASGKVKGAVSSHIPSVPSLAHAEACMVRTAVTAPMAVVLDAQDAAGPVAHVLRAAIQHIYQPGVTRH